MINSIEECLNINRNVLDTLRVLLLSNILFFAPQDNFFFEIQCLWKRLGIHFCYIRSKFALKKLRKQLNEYNNVLFNHLSYKKSVKDLSFEPLSLTDLRNVLF